METNSIDKSKVNLKLDRTSTKVIKVSDLIINMVGRVSFVWWHVLGGPCTCHVFGMICYDDAICYVMRCHMVYGMNMFDNEMYDMLRCVWKWEVLLCTIMLWMIQFMKAYACMLPRVCKELIRLWCMICLKWKV